MIRLLSLFSGIGAFEKALERIGMPYELVNYCEIDKFASKSYSLVHNVPEELNLGDISKVDENSLPDFDLLTYGFPCQDISLAGKQKGIIKGETRSGLLFEALRIIKAKKPKYAIAENVKNLVGKKFKADFDSFLETLGDMGYNSYWKVLNAKDYGVPQNRERVFVISIRKDIDDGTFKFPEKFPLKLRLKDMLEETVDEKYYCSGKSIKGMQNSSYVSRQRLLQKKDVCDTLCARDYKEPKCVEAPMLCTRSDNAKVILNSKAYSKKKAQEILDENPVPKLVGGIGEINFGKQYRQGNRVYDANEVAMCLTASPIGNAGGYSYLYKVSGKEPKCVESPIRLGNIYNEKWGTGYGGNVYSQKGLSPTLNTMQGGGREPMIPIDELNPNSRIRKLTPKECWRLMGFDDSDIDKCIGGGISNSQLYKQAGNSIVVDVLQYIFENLFKGESI